MTEIRRTRTAPRNQKASRSRIPARRASARGRSPQEERAPQCRRASRAFGTFQASPRLNDQYTFVRGGLVRRLLLLLVVTVPLHADAFSDLRGALGKLT